MLQSIIDVIVVGAGMAGLSAARVLFDAGFQVVVVEKTPDVGGRMATRALDLADGCTAIFDCGAQIVYASEPSFVDQTESWKNEGLLLPWQGEAYPGFRPEGAPQAYMSRRGMRRIATKLAEDIPVLSNTGVENIQRIDGIAVLQTDGGAVLRARSVICALPLPITLELFDHDSIDVSRADLDCFESAEYTRAISLLVVPEREFTLPLPGGVPIDAGPLCWIGDNGRRGISPGVPSLTLHANHFWSSHHWDENDHNIAEMLLASYADSLCGKVIATEVVRWTFAQPLTRCSVPFVHVCAAPHIFVAGDTFEGLGLEGAWLSGRAAGKRLAAEHQQLHSE